MAALLYISELERKVKYKHWLIFFFLKKRNCLTSDTKTYLCHIMKLFPIMLSLITGWYQSCYWSCYFWCGSWLHRPVILSCIRITPISNSREVLIIHQCVSTQGRLRTSLSGAGHRLLAWMLAGLRTEELNVTYVMSDFNWKWFPLCTMCAEQDFYVISFSFRILINIFNCMFIIINDRVNPDLFDIVVVYLLLNLLNQISGMLSINWRFIPELQRTHFYPVYQ